MDEFAARASRQRQQLAADPHRPRYHFLPPANWMNDPNGAIEWQGRYHLFYQHNPQAAFWDDMHWGHARSDDLVHWTDLPLALIPGPGSDEDGCWSGCALDDDGTPTLVYTGVQGDYRLPHNQRVCLARADDDLLHWRKDPANPVIAVPPPGLRLTGFRDPCVLREGGDWLMAIGAGIQDVGGAVLLYKSPDLRRWQYLHPLCVGDARDRSGLWTGLVWEVPQFFRLGDRHVLLFTAWDGDPLYAAYFTGLYREGRFVPQALHKLDYGDQHFRAAHSMLDSRGRRIVWGWIGEGRSVEAQKRAGWAGVMSLPRVLDMRADGALAMRPAPELESLRGSHQRYANIVLSPDCSQFELANDGACLEIAAEIDPAGAEHCGLKLLRSPDGVEETLITYDVGRQRLGIDRRRSTQNDADGIDLDAQEGDFPLRPGETLQLRVFVDGSVIEVYANQRACLTSRVYPSRPDSRGAAIFARGHAIIKSVDVWRMASIWEDSSADSPD